MHIEKEKLDHNGYSAKRLDFIKRRRACFLGVETGELLCHLTLSTGDRIAVYSDSILHYRRKYSELDVVRQIMRMADWLAKNPDRCHTQEQLKQLLTGWLNRELVTAAASRTSLGGIDEFKFTKASSGKTFGRKPSSFGRRDGYCTQDDLSDQKNNINDFDNLGF